MDHLGHPARQRHLHQRDRQRLAAGQLFEPGKHYGGHHLYRLVRDHCRRVFGRRQLLRQRADQRTADRAVERIERRQRGLCLWQLEPLPEQHLQRQQLLGRRGFQPGRNADLYLARRDHRHRARCSPRGTTSDSNAVISYQWQSSSNGGTTWANIAGATGSTYTPVEADETRLLRVVETATDSGTSQSGTSTSAATAAVTDIVLAFTSAAAISGTAAARLAVHPVVNGELNDADASVTGYQWQSSSDRGSTWANIAGATSSTYTPVTADQSKVLRVVESATDADGGPTPPPTARRRARS